MGVELGPLPHLRESPRVAIVNRLAEGVRCGEVVGDPTEGALLVLAEKGGIDHAALRQERPRLLEIPFDSDYKFMATFHRWRTHDGRDVVRCFVKGAPDVLAAGEPVLRRYSHELGDIEVIAVSVVRDRPPHDRGTVVVDVSG
jgi:magnesium-transporting ATPase (P-type)